MDRRRPNAAEGTVRLGTVSGKTLPHCRLVPAAIEGPFEPPRWLWEGRIPLGELTILAARGEVGKTTLVLDLAAQLSRGELRGDLLEKNGRTIFFTVRMLADTVRKEKVDLLIFDPIDMVLGGIDAHRNNEVRSALRLIMSAGCTVIGIQHLTKSSSVAYAGDRVMGSAAYRNFARSVLVADYDKTGRDLIVLAHDKSNYGSRQPSLSLKTLESHVEGFPRVQWLDEVSTSADDLLVGGRRGPSLVERCELWLEQHLETHGATTSKEVRRLAKAEGFGRSTTYLARERLGISNDEDGRWTL